ncbi:Transglutaminase-like superfamily protein [Planctomycetes bacterium K23_9]|uniref:Transglutaminase-like superfamily protein n=1 Tax=Stieleria marina TaxID=1930275 RepID=A0A517NNR8_9BACT|nr:Transglutaminase-like superfamily protein [Planctomycetes bacterium K23_9]
MKSPTPLSLPPLNTQYSAWSFSSAARGLVVFVALWIVGCDYIPDRPPLIPPKELNRAKIQADAAAKLIEAPSVGFAGDWESWYGYYLNNQHVGYSHTSAKRLVEDGADRSEANIVYEFQEQLRFRRGQSISVQHLSQSSVETRNGSLQNFESAIKVGPLVSRIAGTVANGQLNVESVRGTNRKTDRIVWESNQRGLDAIEQSLRRTPMAKGDKRALKMLLPHRYQLGIVELFCTGQSATSMIDGSYQSLLEIVSVEKVDGKVVSEQVLWTDDEGLIRKKLRSGVGMVAYRMGRQAALKDAIEEQDLFDATIVNVSGSIDRQSETKQVAYVVLPTEDLVQAGKTVSVPTTPGQFIRMMEDGSVRILVNQSADAVRQGFSATKLQPSDGDLKPNAFIDSNHGDVRRIATAAIRGDLSQEEIALTLARTAKDLLNPRPTSEGFVRASTVVQKTTGGSTEHALVLAALLRAKGIPSRLAMGIKYVPDQEAMAYHVWTLAHVDGEKWISLDAMTGQQAAADRITFVTTNLNDGNPFNAVAAVLAMMSRIQIEIKSAVY